MRMKAIVVEGMTDMAVLEGLFPQIKNDKKISVRVAQGFSSAFATMKTLVDYGYDVLAVFDTDTHVPGNDNRTILNRILPLEVTGRSFKIVWMDTCLEDVLGRTVPEISRLKKGGEAFIKRITQHSQQILQEPECREIQRFVHGE